MVTDRRARRVIVCAAALYLLGVARMTLWPDFASPEQFDALRSAVAWLTARSIPVSYDGVEAAANVVMFVPFGVLGGLLVSRRGRWAVLTAGCATSAAIETSQLLFLPTRVATVQDVVLNTAGTAVGLLGLVVVVAARRTRPDATRVQ